MKEFNNKINVSNKDKFKLYHYERILCYMRRDIFEHVIREEENFYFELDIFFKKYKIKDDISMEKMTSTVISELEDQGWKCKTSFGGTGLFIYSSENPPENCFEDGF